LILVRAEDVREGISRANLQISKTLKRIKQLDLKVAESKTEIVIFRNRKRKMVDQLCLRVGHEMIPVKRSIKYLGVYLDQEWSFKEHTEYIEQKATRVARQLGRLMPNLRGPSEKKRRLYANTISSVILYAAPIWSDEIGGTAKLRQQITRVQRTIAIRVISGYRTVSADAALLLARIVPVAIHASYYKRVYSRISDLKRNDEWDKCKEKEVKEDEKILLLRQWQILISNQRAFGKRTCEAIGPHLNVWFERIHGELTYRATQLLTGHGCFNTFLYRIGKEDSPLCSHCNINEDSAEHTLKTCERWSEERGTLQEVVGPDLSLATLIGKMCESEEAWNSFLHFAEGIRS